MQGLQQHAGGSLVGASALATPAQACLSQMDFLRGDGYNQITAVTTINGDHTQHNSVIGNL
jgi:hypothetical protein